MVRRLMLFSLVLIINETHIVCLYLVNSVIKYSINLRRLTSKGKIAYTKRHFETYVLRENAKLKIFMGRLTNPSYNFLAELKVLRSLSVRNYVVFLTLDRLKESTLNKRIKKGSPKLIRRRKQTEFVITRNLKKWGLRKIHSTNNSFVRKESSYIMLEKKCFRVSINLTN